MTAPELAIGQVWQTPGNLEPHILTIAEVTAAEVKAAPHWSRTGDPLVFDRAHWPPVGARFMGWGGPPGTVLPALEPLDVAPMGMQLAEYSQVFRDGSPARWSAELGGDLTLADVEEGVTGEDPEGAGDWRLHTETALSGRVFQRQGPDRWVAVRRLAGYA